jgi:hypothetical protein
LLARRTTVVRLLLAVLALGAVGAAYGLSRTLESERTFIPADTTAVVVLDVSSSISTDTYARIEQTLRELSRTKDRYGLVVFSDTAYEVLPPGTPATELAPLVRFFTVRDGGTFSRFPPSPWSRSFAGGTRISAGLELARGILTGDGSERGSILLVSDLDNDPQDSARLVRAVLVSEKAGIPIHVVGLNPSAEDVAYFTKLLGDPSRITPAGLPEEALRTRSIDALVGDIPVALLVAAGLLALLLALNELWCARLAWREGRP